MAGVPPLSSQTPIVDPGSGKPSNFFMRLWGNIFTSKSLKITADRTIIKYDGFGNPDPSDQTTTFTASKTNSQAGVSWTVKDSSGNNLNPALYLSSITGDVVSMTRTQFEAAIAVNSTNGVRVIASMTDEGDVYRDQATLTKVRDGQSGTSGSNGADGTDGLSIAEVTCFIRAASLPSTPSGGSFDFTTKVLTPPSSWFVVPPSGTDILWMARGTVSVVGQTGTATPTWLGVGKVAQDGSNGTSGTSGLTVEITNSAIPLWAYADGTVLTYAPATGSAKVLIGTTDISSSFSLSVVSNPQALTVGITGMTYGITGGFDPSEDNATLVLRITGSGSYSGYFFDKTINLSKQKGGYEIVSSLPVSNLFTGRVVFLTSDNKLYRYTGSAWVSSVPSTDITGQLSDSQLAAIAAAKITGQIVSTQITDGSISTPKIAAGAVTASQIAADTITASQIAANAITASELAAGSVTTAKLVANAVTANEIAAGAVTAAKINVTNLSAITATIGTLRTATSGARTEISDNLITGYFANDALCFRLGVW